MKNNAILGAVIGFAAGTAAAIAGKIAVDKVVEEIKGELGDQTFTSPEGNNRVTISSGSSTTAKGRSSIPMIHPSVGSPSMD